MDSSRSACPGAAVVVGCSWAASGAFVVSPAVITQRLGRASFRGNRARRGRAGTGRKTPVKNRRSRPSRAASDDAQREQFLAGRADLDLRAHLRADAAVEAGGPAAVVDIGLAQRVLPVLPEPVPVQARVQVVPGQHLDLVALAGDRKSTRLNSSHSSISYA